MRNLTNHIVGLSLLLLATTVQAQDVHYAQLFNAPLRMNPAATGVFQGNMRLAANYRSQWSSISANPFRTAAASMDVKLFQRDLGGDFAGLGLAIMNDRAGEMDLSITEIGLSLAYAKALTSRRNAYISIGGQANSTRRTMDFSKLIFDEQFDVTTGSIAAAHTEDVSNTMVRFMNYSVGSAIYFYKDRVTFLGGASLSNTLRNDLSFFTSTGTDAQYRRLVVHGTLKLSMSHRQRYALIPRLVYMSQGRSDEYLAGMFAYFPLTSRQREAASLETGAMFRLVNRMDDGLSADAIVLYAQLMFKEWHLGFSYDLNTSSLTTASHARGGAEFSLIRIFSWGKDRDDFECPFVGL